MLCDTCKWCRQGYIEVTFKEGTEQIEVHICSVYANKIVGESFWECDGYTDELEDTGLVRNSKD